MHYLIFDSHLIVEARSKSHMCVIAWLNKSFCVALELMCAKQVFISYPLLALIKFCDDGENSSGVVAITVKESGDMRKKKYNNCYKKLFINRMLRDKAQQHTSDPSITRKVLHGRSLYADDSGRPRKRSVGDRQR